MGNGVFDDDAFIGRGSAGSVFQNVRIDAVGEAVIGFATLRNGAGDDIGPSGGVAKVLFRISSALPPETDGCPCDWDQNGTVLSDDFFAFVNAFLVQGDADYNDDGVTNSDDFFDFLFCFMDPHAACPPEPPDLASMFLFGPDMAIDGLVVSEETIDMPLLTRGNSLEDHTVSWSSDNPDIVPPADHTVVFPEDGEIYALLIALQQTGDLFGTLTASISGPTVNGTVAFDVGFLSPDRGQSVKCPIITKRQTIDCATGAVIRDWGERTWISSDTQEQDGNPGVAIISKNAEGHIQITRPVRDGRKVRHDAPLPQRRVRLRAFCRRRVPGICILQRPHRRRPTGFATLLRLCPAAITESISRSR